MGRPTKPGEIATPQNAIGNQGGVVVNEGAIADLQKLWAGSATAKKVELGNKEDVNRIVFDGAGLGGAKLEAQIASQAETKLGENINTVLNKKNMTTGSEYLGLRSFFGGDSHVALANIEPTVKNYYAEAATNAYRNYKSLGMDDTNALSRAHNDASQATLSTFLPTVWNGQAYLDPNANTYPSFEADTKAILTKDPSIQWQDILTNYRPRWFPNETDVATGQRGAWQFVHVNGLPTDIFSGVKIFPNNNQQKAVEDWKTTIKSIENKLRTTPADPNADMPWMIN